MILERCRLDFEYQRRLHRCQLVQASVRKQAGWLIKPFYVIYRPGPIAHKTNTYILTLKTEETIVLAYCLIKGK